MASPTRSTWVWVNPGCWWWTGRPGVLRFMGLQRVGHDWATELNWTEYGMAHRFIELDKVVVHVINLISFFATVVFILSALRWTRTRGLWKLPDGRDWLRGKLGLVLMGVAMLSKSLIQFSVDGWCCVWLPSKGGHTQFPHPCSRPLPTHSSTGDSWTLTGMSRSVSYEVTAPFSWVLVCTRFCLYPPRVCFPSPLWVLAALMGLMSTSYKRVYTIPRSAAPRAPAQLSGHCWPVPPQETLKHSKAGLAQSLWDKMAEEKEVSSSSPVRTPKLQLTAQHLLTGES